MLRFKRSVMTVSAVLLALVAPLIAQSPRENAGAVEYRPDYSAMRREIEKVETVVDASITATFNGDRTVLTGKTKGAYLAGYGVSFSSTVNIYRGVLTTPFGTVRTDDLSPEQKRRLIEEVKDKLTKILFESGGGLRQIKGEDRIAFTGFFEDRNFPGEQNLTRTVTLSILKKDLDEASRAEDRWKEFKTRMKTVEY